MPSSASRWTLTQTYHKTTTLHEGDRHLHHSHGQLGLDHVKGHHAQSLNKTPCRPFGLGMEPMSHSLDGCPSGTRLHQPSCRVRQTGSERCGNRMASSMLVPKRARALWQIDVPVRRGNRLLPLLELVFGNSPMVRDLAKMKLWSRKF